MEVPFEYTFLTDSGQKVLTYGEYLRDSELMGALNDPGNPRVIMGRHIYCFSKQYLAQKPDVLKGFESLDAEWQANRFAYYAPSTPSALAFINDTGNDILIRRGPNRTGKTTDAVIKWLLGPPAAFPMDAAWPIFAEHGVKHQAYQGPLRLGVASYEVQNMIDTIWPIMVQFWLPEEQLGIYAKSFNGVGAKDSPAWGHNPSLAIDCGTDIGFFTYRQSQGIYESGVRHRWLWDEQGLENLFDGADARTRTVRGTHIFSLTPHKVKGRPDTGAGSWIHDLDSGRVTKGHDVATYVVSVNDTPDWYYPETEKTKEIEKWDKEPNRAFPPNTKVIAEGRARLYGEWHQTAGLVFDEWDASKHVIAPLWETPPQNYTIYRGLDHGVTNPTACISLAVDAERNIFMYREFYSKGKLISENVRDIIEAAGNKRKELGGHVKDERSGMIFQRHEEIYATEHPAKQVLDPRSFATKEPATGKIYGDLYRMAGLHTVRAAPGKFSYDWVPAVKELLKLVPDKEHIATGEQGAPRLYVFSTCVNFIREIERYRWADSKDSENQKETPRKKDDHGINALAYAVMSGLRYMVDIYWPNDNVEHRTVKHGRVDDHGYRRL